MQNKQPNFRLVTLTENTQIKHFDSGDVDFNDFLFNDAKEYTKQLLAVTYLPEFDIKILQVGLT